MSDKLGKCRPDGRTFCEGMKVVKPGEIEKGLAGFKIAWGWVEPCPPGTKARYCGIVYRRRTKDRGIFLTFCPWCREPLIPPDLMPKGDTPTQVVLGALPPEEGDTHAG